MLNSIYHYTEHKQLLQTEVQLAIVLSLLLKVFINREIKWIFLHKSRKTIHEYTSINNSHNKFSQIKKNVEQIPRLYGIVFYSISIKYKKINRIVTNCLILSNNSIIFYIKKQEFFCKFYSFYEKVYIGKYRHF